MPAAESHPLLPAGAAPAQRASPAAAHATITLGFGLMFLSALCQACMSLLVHVAELRFGLASAVLLLIRAFFSLSTSMAVLGWTGKLGSLRDTPRAALLPLAVRGLGGASTTACNFLALARIPVGEALTIFYVSPTLTTVLAALLHGDAFTRWHAVLLVVNFGGVALVARPSGAEPLVSGAASAQGVALALAAAASSTTVALSMRHLRGVHAVVITAAYGVGCLVVAVLLVRPEELRAAAGNRAGLLCAVVSALGGFGAQMLYAMGMKRAPAGPAVVVRTVNVPVVFTLGFFLLGETVSLLNLSGVVLVIGSVIGIGMLSLRSGREEVTDNREIDAAASEKRSTPDVPQPRVGELR